MGCYCTASNPIEDSSRTVILIDLLRFPCLLNIDFHSSSCARVDYNIFMKLNCLEGIPLCVYKSKVFVLATSTNLNVGFIHVYLLLCVPHRVPFSYLTIIVLKYLKLAGTHHST